MKHIDHVDNYQTSLEEARVKLTIKKCKFITDKNEYLDDNTRPGKL